MIHYDMLFFFFSAYNIPHYELNDLLPQTLNLEYGLFLIIALLNKEKQGFFYMYYL